LDYHVGAYGIGIHYFSIERWNEYLFFRYYLTENSQVAFLENVGFPSWIKQLSEIFGAEAFSEFSQSNSAPYATSSIINASSTIAMIVGIFFSKPLADKFGKRNIFAHFYAFRHSVYCQFT
jgi:MFS family permease